MNEASPNIIQGFPKTNLHLNCALSACLLILRNIGLCKNYISLWDSQVHENSQILSSSNSNIEETTNCIEPMENSNINISVKMLSLFMLFCYINYQNIIAKLF